jgi:predicted phage terminase large subunit-like protein
MDNIPVNMAIFNAVINSYGGKCKDNFYEFFKYFWSVVDDAELHDNWHIKYLCDELQSAAESVFENKPKKHDLVINVPPGSTKSMICSVLFPVWCWVNQAGLRFIVSSYSSSLADDFAIKSRDIINSPDFKQMYSDITLRIDRNQIKKYENNHKGVRFSMGFNGTITGKHGDIIIIDDPLKADDAYSSTKREHANRIITNTLSRRKRDNKVSLTILIMQRLHEDDPSAVFLKRKKIKHICLPGKLTDKVFPDEVKQYYVDGLLDPFRLDEDVLDEAKTDMGSFGYSAQILQDPIDSETAIFNPSWWMRYDSLPGFNFKLQTWDTAFKKGQFNDYTVCETWGLNINGFYLIDTYRNKMTFPDLVQETKNQFNKYTPNIILIEDTASGQSLIQQLQRDTKLPIKAWPAMDKVVRAHEVSPRIEAGQVYLPYQAKWLQEFLSEHSSFPNSTHDDQVDCTGISLQYLLPIFNRMHRGASKSITENNNINSSINYSGYR